ncbi:hypothetical protein CI41S_23980 [Bradyrhizobium ivorense]|nr:hypothetical protein CI41S_23980 [Bradyrhizobium ivorense]
MDDQSGKVLPARRTLIGSEGVVPMAGRPTVRPAECQTEFSVVRSALPHSVARCHQLKIAVSASAFCRGLPPHRLSHRPWGSRTRLDAAEGLLRGAWEQAGRMQDVIRRATAGPLTHGIGDRFRYRCNAAIHPMHLGVQWNHGRAGTISEYWKINPDLPDVSSRLLERRPPPPATLHGVVFRHLFSAPCGRVSQLS